MEGIIKPKIDAESITPAASDNTASQTGFVIFEKNKPKAPPRIVAPPTPMAQSNTVSNFSPVSLKSLRGF